MRNWILVFFLVPFCLITAQTLVINEIMTSNSRTIKDEDNDFSDWIEIYNTTALTINLSGFGLSDDLENPLKWKLPAINIAPKKSIIVFASGKDRYSFYAHTNFNLKSSGEWLALSDVTGRVIDSLTVPSMESDISFGRKPDGTGPWFFFAAPTPEMPNISQTYTCFAGTPEFIVKGGFFKNSCPVSISSTASGAVVYYTTDGSEPLQTGTKYNGPFLLTKTTTVRAKVFLDEALPGRTVSETYIINPPAFTLPVVALSTDPKNLWDENTGIYVMGKNASVQYPYFGANFWQDWEKSFNFQFYDQDGTQKLNADCGLKIFGMYSRANDQKSFSLFAGNGYGIKDFLYTFFPGIQKDKFPSLVLRNGGNDFSGTLLRDRLSSLIFQDISIGAQATGFVHCYLNGEYWGIYTLREKLNEHFIASAYNVNPDSIDFLEMNGTVILGSNKDYNSLISFISKNSPSLQANYDYIKTKIDVENFRNYEIAQIFINNTDWPGNNIKYWREQKPGGKWRWILYDTDFAYGFTNGANGMLDYQFNMLNFATAPNGTAWPNPAWSTLLLRKMLESGEFKNDFIVAFIHLLNTRFRAGSLLGKFNTVKGELQNDITLHLGKWKNSIWDWDSNVSIVRTFLEKRELFMRGFVMNYFNLTEAPFLKLDLSDPEGGTITLQGFPVTGFPFSEVYPAKLKIRLVAKPAAGYKFTGWEGDIKSDSASITIEHLNEISLKAVFSPVSEKEKIVINEINYKSSADFDAGDWIELYNNGQDTVNLRNWLFKDADDLHVSKLPGFNLYPGEYLVLVNDSTLFKSRFPEVKNAAACLESALSSKGDITRIYNPSGRLIDSVKFGIDNNWPEQPNGTGSTLSLINPKLDNSLAVSWKASSGYGTPGKVNDVYTTAEGTFRNLKPISYSLSQNFPNPFNPSTQINYSIPEAGRVRLSVYDLLGKKIAELVNEEKPAGFYSVFFDASGRAISSGIYFYCLETDGFRQSRKFILTK